MIIIAIKTMNRERSTRGFETISQGEYVNILNKYITAASRYQTQQAIEKIDKQIQGTVISIEDEKIGKYKIQYQDCIFYAYSQNGQKYQKKDIVYISIPENDMSQKKYILGEVAELKNKVKILKTKNYVGSKNFCYFDEIKLPYFNFNNLQTEFIYMYIDENNKELYAYNNKDKYTIIDLTNIKNNFALDEEEYGRFLYNTVNGNENLYWKISFKINYYFKEKEFSEDVEIQNKIIRNFKKNVDFGCKINVYKNQKEYTYIFNLDSLEGTPFLEDFTKSSFYIPIKEKDEFIYDTEEQKELESLCGITKLSFFVNLSEDMLKDEDNFYTENGETFRIKEKLEDYYKIFENSISLSNLSIVLVQEIE